MGDDREKGVAQLSAGDQFSRVAWRVVVCVITAGLLLLTIALVGVRLLGLTPYSLQMLSTAPDYQPGDLLYVRRTKFADIRVGDTVAYVTAGDLEVEVRRVLSVDADKRHVSVENAVAVTEGRILGVVVISVPWLGDVSTWLTGSAAKYAALVLLTVLLASVLAEYGRA